MAAQLLSYEDFINSPISVSQLVQQLISHGADQHKLEKLAQRAGYVYLPGTRAYSIGQNLCTFGWLYGAPCLALFLCS